MSYKFLKMNKLYLASIVVIALSLILLFNHNLFNDLRDQKNSKKRTILSKVETTNLNKQLKLTILKIKKNNQMFLEVYGHLNHGLELMETLNLDGKFDAKIILKNQTTNLFITNVDRTEDLEILAPTYSRDMRPILNIFKYDPNFEEFKRVNTKSNKPIL